MASMVKSLLLVILALFTTTTIVYANTPQPCNSFNFSNRVNYVTCVDLPVLASSLHWNYQPSTGMVDIAFKKANATDSSWIAWAINPTSKGMVGSQAFVAFRRLDGSFKAYASPITTYATMLEEGTLSFPVHSISASYLNGHMIIFASFQLPTNTTWVNHVWQEGLVSNEGTLIAHSMSESHLQSFGTLDFASGKVSQTEKLNSRITLRNVHGILNVISWGILMPIGVIFARYLKTFECLGPTWFHLHRACQSLAYLIGIVGFGTGIYEGNYRGIHHTPHRCIGITLICLASAQVCVAAFLRPNKDHKYRVFWNIFHYIVGYGTIVLAILNVLKGFDILNAQKWKNVYSGGIMCLATIALMLEVITWILVYTKKSKNSKELSDINHQIP